MPFLANLPWPKEVLEGNLPIQGQPQPLKPLLSAFQAHPRLQPLQLPVSSHTLPRPPWLSPHFRPIQPEDEVTTQSNPLQPEIPLPSTLPKHRSTFVVKIPKVQPFDPTNCEDKAHSISGAFGSLCCYLFNCDPTCTILQCFPADASRRYTLPVIGPLSPLQDFPTSLEQLQGHLLDMDPSPKGSSAHCRVHLAYSLPTFEFLAKLNDKGRCSPYVFIKEWKQSMARHIAHKFNARASQHRDTMESGAPLDIILPEVPSQNPRHKG